MPLLQAMSEENQSSTEMEIAAPPAPAVSGRPSRERKQVEIFKPPTEDEKKKEISIIEGAGMTLSEYEYFNDQWVSIIIVYAPRYPFMRDDFYL